MEELNQVQDLNQDPDTAVDLPDSFFGDDSTTEEEETLSDVQETSQDIPVEEAEVSEQSEEEVQESKPESFLTITYNKQPKELTQEETIEYAQKGMNYDKLHEMYEALKPMESTYQELNRLAQLNNMSVEDYLKNLSDVQNTFEINQEIEMLKQKYPNSDEEALAELATLQVNEKKEANQKRMLAQNQESVDARKQEISRQLDIFERRYPDVDPSKLDFSVYELMKDGFTLLEAYESVNAEKRKLEDKQRESKEKINKQNEENRKKSLGNINTQGIVEKDDFLSGFLE